MLIFGSAYATAWVVYVACFAIAYFAFTRLTRPMRPVILRQILKGFLIALFLTPVAIAVDESGVWYAPAWLQGGYESVLGNAAAASGAFFNLAVAAAVMAFILAIDAFWRRRKADRAETGSE
jgi:hypothetical protein